MIINMSGGGAGLNFKIVGGTVQPSNPSMNTIWVNTPNEITSWTFAPSTPSDPSEGMLWLSIKTSGSYSINVLKKNAIVFYLGACKQYTSGSWNTVQAYIYQGGWDFFGSLYLYDNGKNVDYTFACTGAMKHSNSGYTSNDCLQNGASVKDESGMLTFINGSRAYSFIEAFTTEKIDCSQYDTITIKGTLTGASKTDSCMLRFLTDIGILSSDNNAFTHALSTGIIDTALDISSVSSSCYIGFTFYNEATTFKITEIYLS